MTKPSWLSEIESVSDIVSRAPVPLPEWIGGGLLVKGTTLLLGSEAKQGKSFVSFEFCEALVNGRPVFGDPRFPVETPCRVLLIEQEVGRYGVEQRLRDRYTIRGVPPPTEWFIASKVPMKLNLTGLPMLIEAMQRYKPQIVMFDPVTKLILKEGNEQVHEMFEVLDEAARRTDPDTSFVLIHHFNQQVRGRDRVYEDPLDPYRMRGGSNFVGNAASLMMLGNRKDVKTGSVLWTLDARLILRHGESPPDFNISINRDWSITRSPGGRKPSAFEGLGR